VLDLSDRALTRVPQYFEGYIKSNIIYLNLRGNKIEKLFEDDLRGFNQLNRLDMKINRLTFIEEKAFAGCSTISSLALDENQLADIPSGSLSLLGQLQDLYLSHNPISRIRNDAFRNNSLLRSLYIYILLQHLDNRAASLQRTHEAAGTQTRI